LIVDNNILSFSCNVFISLLCETKLYIIAHVYQNFTKSEDLILRINKIKDLIKKSKNKTHLKSPYRSTTE